MVVQNGHSVNLDSRNREVGQAGDSGTSGGFPDDRFALGQFKVAYLAGYILGTSVLAGSRVPECLNRWMNP